MNVDHRRATVMDRSEALHKWMRTAHFVVAIGADQQQITGVWVREQVLDERQAGCVDPLQVVQEEDQRMCLAREHGHELPEDQTEPVLSLSRRQRRHRSLRADDQFDFGQHIENELAVDPDRSLQLLPPAGDPRGTFSQQLLHQLAKRLRKCGIGNVALVLIELA
ncbi:hypothetical protein PQR27_37120 [Paraburkholderia fungorum]